MISSAAISSAIPLAAVLAEDGDEFEDLPDTGYVFVYHQDGRQVFTADNRAVQVPVAYANS